MTGRESSDLNSLDPEWLRPVVHLHAPTTGPVCGAPVPTDRTKMTAYRSETTCPACLATLRPLGGAA